MASISIGSVSKSFGEVAVLRDVSLSLSPGDSACVMGPSGSGKSTLLYMLGGLEPPTSGTVRLDATNPYTLSAEGLAAFRNREIGFVLQDHCLLPQCTVLENVLVPTLVGEADSDAPARAYSHLKTMPSQPALPLRIRS